MALKERQKRKLRVSIITVAVLLIVCMMASSCGTKEGDSQAVSTASESNLSDAAAPGSQTAGGQKKNSASSMQEDKSETVYAKADAQGNITEITVQDILKCDSAGGQISDYSILENIKNTEGDEEYTRQPDGTLLWDNQGQDISYEGTTDQDLPVSVKISYELDGKELRAEDLAGQSGRLKMRFDYENHTSEIVTVDGQDREVKVPFSVFSALLLDTDIFSNVEVSNGKIISMGDQQVAVGYAFPGLTESLKLKDSEAAEDMELPDYVEITADVTDFELEFTATVITTGLFADMDTDNLKDADDLVESMKDLAEASGKLSEGSGELLKGGNEFQTGLDQYVEGVGTVQEGIRSLKNGLSALDENTSALTEGAQALQGGSQALDEGIQALQGGSQALDEGIQALQGGSQALDESVQALQEGAEALLDSVEMMEQAQAMADAAAAQQARAQVMAALEQALAGNDSLTEEEKSQICSAAADSIQISGNSFGELQQLENGSKQLQNGIGQLQNGIGQLRDGVGQLQESTGQLQAGARQLNEGSEQLAEGINVYGQGVSQLAEGAEALYDGSDQLIASGSALSKGMDTLLQGIRSLSEGMSAFDKEGIQKLKDLAESDLSNVLTGIKAVKEADKSYDNFSGISENKTGSVKFIIETEGIKE